ncbi:ABC transporter substrate-binding protein [Cellulomonas sp. ATA003]|uniref:ABC transporter substrate-binding protein n=1 Tax=Cellulomonas sp. ATA003 TaxID=3073064 RepID=UPI002873263F|nr:ABC transporter substrate-binding protein [Cellulomonas sp. ATA003]WNB86191.1 ABC transporter substrate-binding protein [Cellulomonas sp. ATA003]
MRRATRFLPAAVMAAAALALTSCATDGAAGGSGDAGPVVFGVSGPLSGDQAQYGEDWQRGFDLALEEINASGDLDRAVEIDFQDSQGEASQATAIAQRFVSDDEVLAVMGDFSSATSMVASPIFQRGGLLQLGITNSHPEFTSTGDWIFSPSITQEVEGRYLEDGVAALGDSVAVFHLNTDWGNAAFEVFEDQAAANGTEIVYSTPVEETSTDFRPQLLSARDSGAETLAFLTYYNTTALLVQQAQGTGLADVPVVAVSSNYSEEFTELGADAAEGTYVATVFFPAAADPEVQRFVEAFEEMHGVAPNQFAAFAYDGLKQLAWAYGNSDGTREGVRDALREGTDIPSVIFGPFSYNDERRIDDPTFTWLQVQDGAFVETDTLTSGS